VLDLEIVGGHVHARLTDPSGFQATAAEALEALEAAGAHGAVFAVSDLAGYRKACIVTTVSRQTSGAASYSRLSCLG
jgi:hypothetical protein